MTQQRISAGILLFRIKNGTLELFLVHPGGPFFSKKDIGFWSIPKGEIDEDEDYLSCAIRELQEETGLILKKDDGFIPLGSVRQKGGKIVHAWALKYESDIVLDNSKSFFTVQWPPNSGRRQSFPEVDRAEFMQALLAKQKINMAQVELINTLENYLSQLKG